MPRLTAVPALRLSAPSLRTRVRLLIGFLFLSSALGILGAFAWKFYTPLPSPPSPPVPKGAAVAQTAVEDFLSGRNFTVPVAANVPTAGGVMDPTADQVSSLVPDSITLQHSEQPPPVMTRKGSQTYEIDTFLVHTGGRLLAVKVTTLLTNNGAVLAALPTIEPAPSGGTRSKVDPLDYLDIAGSSAEATGDVQTRVGMWANAFAESGPSNPNLDQALRDIANTPTPPGYYKGLNGQFSVQGDPQIVSTVPATTKSGKNALGVRVRLSLTSTAAKGFVVSSDYDLLVTEATTSVPKVIDWGPAGSLPQLAERN